MALLASRGVHVIHNPVSNLKLGSGIAPVPDMVKAGLNVALGTDGASSNNSLDLFEELKLAATLHSGVRRDPTAVTPMEAIRMATVNGAKALGRHTGVIAPGYMADLILLDFDQPHLMPCHDPVENVVFCAHGSDVCLTMARGKVLYENGAFLSLDLEAIKKEVETYAMPRLFS
jgi:5-methylthioadenosine/S-adenosylhomocysteine deaminase